MVILQDRSRSEEPIENLLRLSFNLKIMLASRQEVIEHHPYHSVNLSLFGTELELDEFHRLWRKGYQSLPIQNRVFVASQERRLEDGLKAICRELRAFLFIPCDQLVELAPVVPRPQLQEANQPIGVGECVDDRCAGRTRD